MSDDPQPSPPDQPNRRSMLRSVAKASTMVIREDDMMQVGVEGQLKDVSTSGVGILMKTPPKLNEQVKVVLANEVQRVIKETRGVVRHITQEEDGNSFVEIDLIIRLTPLEASLFKMGIPPESDPDKPVWI